MTKSPNTNRAEKEKKLCGSKIAGTNGAKRCRSTFLYANGRCKKHGGPTPHGIASPHHKHGGYSKDLPTRMAARCRESLEDKEVLELHRDLAVAESHLSELAKSLKGGSSRLMFHVEKALNGVLVEYGRANSGKKKALSGVLLGVELEKLQEAVKQAKAEWLTWREIKEWIRLRKELVESERRRMVESHSMITLDEQMVLISAFVKIVLDHVPDMKTRQSITDDWERLMNARYGGEAVRAL